MALAGLMSVCLVPRVIAQPALFHTDGGAAIGGYDPVSYFDAGGPQPGLADISVMWKGAVWHFANQANRETFEADPRAYAPRFGGYCAYGVAMGYKAGTDPMAWRIVDDRLYLIHSQAIEQLWALDVTGNIGLAEANWPGIRRD